MVSFGSREVFLLLEPSLQFVDLGLRKEDTRFPSFPLSGALGIFQVSFLLLQALVQRTHFCSNRNGQSKKREGKKPKRLKQCSVNCVRRERAPALPRPLCDLAPQAAAATGSCGRGSGPAPLFKYLFSNFPSGFFCLFENKDAPCTELSVTACAMPFVLTPAPTPRAYAQPRELEMRFVA